MISDYCNKHFRWNFTLKFVIILCFVGFQNTSIAQPPAFKIEANYGPSKIWSEFTRWGSAFEVGANYTFVNGIGISSLFTNFNCKLNTTSDYLVALNIKTFTFGPTFTRSIIDDRPHFIHAGLGLGIWQLEAEEKRNGSVDRTFIDGYSVNMKCGINLQLIKKLYFNLYLSLPLGNFNETTNTSITFYRITRLEVLGGLSYFVFRK